MIPEGKAVSNTDTERKARNALWAANQAYDTLGLISRHEAHLRNLVARFKGEPAFLERIRELGLCSELGKRTDQ